MRVFTETQGFNQWWIKLLYMSGIVFVLFCCYNWYVLEKGTGNVLPTDTVGQAAVLCTVLLAIIFLYIIKLETTIDEIGVHYQFFHLYFSKKTIPWHQIEKFYVRTYKPLSEYGGWGYRLSLSGKGKALNIRRNKGIQLELNTSKKLLLGTQYPEDAQKVINRYFKKDERV